MDKRTFKDNVYGNIAQLSKAMANPHRLEIIDLLAQGEKTVEVISGETGLSVANASQHLQVLKKARLVLTRRQSQFIYYKLASLEVFNAWYGLRSLAMHQLPGVEKVISGFRAERGTLEGLSIDALLSRLDSKGIILLDVRPADEYQLGHIPQALTLPPDTWDTRMSSLPRQKEIIVYCRGPFCVYADEAVARLKTAGYHATRLNEGFPDWQRRGLPIAC